MNETSLCLVLEFCEKLDLHQFLKASKSSFTEESVIIYFTNILLACSSITNSIDSPNLLPENILVCESSILKVKNYNKWSKYDLSRLSAEIESDNS